MQLHIYDSARKAVVPFVPQHDGEARIYLCGATVQGSPHIGHVRSAIAFDVLIRWLRRAGLRVTYVRNVTDIDDKILTKSAEAGWPWWAWAQRFEREFAEAYRALGVLPATYEPHATAHIPDQIALAQRLIEAGHAYADGAGNVYFDVRSLPDYGSLTRQRLDDMRTTEDAAQIDDATEAGKRDPRDFALWKAAKPSEPDTAAWDSPWGRGRPGWHLECSAMAQRYLGDSFDIHGGGIDLRFPHHENEQAQSHGAGWGFAAHWMHNAWVTIKGEKMSKSLGNSLVVSEILRTTPAPVLRYALGTAHYRSTVEYSPDSLELADATWERLSSFVTRAARVCPEVEAAYSVIGGDREREGGTDLGTLDLPEAFTAALNDDLNIAGAIAAIHEAVKAGHAALGRDDAEGVRAAGLSVRAMLDVLGLDPLSDQWRGFVAGSGADEAMEAALDALVRAQLEERAEARTSKDWARADAIRDRLSGAGIVVEDGKDGATWHLA
ncbi:cysteine--tRNA ligase [Nanchangia anserum]|uniref:Cysteine--tRNA ligase n=1 Tax=Nanchangia anserum TaxID=2692125 RepID=A0A8I0G979_9ACTO|nr:cysteine--tRNA ligase [Nanchangia anserum]MBD3689489.1 cysteine--tRNA ligase [Nanchangia anserum]QOX81680.1 cysteine--tRNA ligase [Nanchangia anserum]